MIMAEYPANMDESTVESVVPKAESFFESSVLMPMGIRIYKLNVVARLNEVINEFNETYLETMDFLTQILPLAREQFGRSDNLLLPKTPSKKRHRKLLQNGSCNQENRCPNFAPQAPAEELPPVKRITRSSRRNNPTQSREEPLKKRSARGRDEPSKKRSAKGRPKKSEQPKVAFVSEGAVPVLTDVKSSPNVCTLKRTSSTSPVSIKPVKKKSKSSDESLADEVISVKEQTSTPVSTEPLQPLSISSIGLEVETKSEARELVAVVSEKGETKLHAPDKSAVEKMDVDVVIIDDEKNEPPTDVLVEIDHGSKVVKKDEAVLVCDSPSPSVELPLAKVEQETAILVNIKETLPAANEIAEKITEDEAFAEPSVVNEFPGTIVSETVVKETCEEITGKEGIDERYISPMKTEAVDVQPAESGDLDSPVQQLRRSKRLSKQINAAEDFVEPKQKKQADKPILNAKTTSDGQDDTQSQPVQQLRRSKRLSKQVNAAELLVEPKHERPVDKLISDEESTSDSQDEALPVVSVNSESKSTRRSNQRVGKVSTGFKRRSSRRSSRQAGYFKKPVALKQIEVHLNDLGINEVVKREPSAATRDMREAVLSGSELSSTESEDDAPKMSAPITRSNIAQSSSKTDSSSDEPSEGTVAGIIQKINRKTLQNEQTSFFKTPSGIRKIKRIGSAVQGTQSHQKPPNLVGGNVKSFIKRQSVKKLDANEIVRQKKLDLQRKEEKDKERKDQAELRRKNWADEQKRKREEKQKRVAEAKAAREREEQDKKQRQLEEKRQMLYASEQARKKREHEEETKKRLREQRTKEAEARRIRENEERLKRLQEKEEDGKMYREMLKRKQEQEELERKQKIQEEKRVLEQKQRERAREKEEERERRLREIKEREAKKLEKEEAEKKEKEERERKQREHEERQNKRIAQLIKEKMEQEKKLREEKLREENERKQREEQRRREEQRKREEQRAAMLEAVRNADTYLMTPPPAQTRKPATSENYDISDIRSDESTDDEDAPRKKVPYWAQGAALKSALLQQEEHQRVFEELASGFVPHAPDLEKIFTKKRKRFYQRTSSAHWNSPPLKV